MLVGALYICVCACSLEIYEVNCNCIIMAYIYIKNNTKGVDKLVAGGGHWGHVLHRVAYPATKKSKPHPLLVKLLQLSQGTYLFCYSNSDCWLRKYEQKVFCFQSKT